MSFYRNIFKKSIEISWKSKYLWFFGIFAALLGGGASEFLLQSSFDQSNGFVLGCQQYMETGVFSWQSMANLGLLFRTDFWAVFNLLLFFLAVAVLAIFFIWLSTVSQVAIVDSSAASFSRRKIDQSISGGISAGNRKFWPVLGLNFFTKAVLSLLLIIVGQMLLFSVVLDSMVANVLLVALFVIFFAIAAFFSLMMKYAIAFVVVENKKICSAIKSGWNLFLKNWLVSIEMSLLLFFITFFFVLAVVLSVLVLVIPFIFLGFIFLEIFSVAGLMFIVFLGFLLSLVFIVLSGSLLTIFTISSWTGLFLQLINKGGASKIMRLAQVIQK